MFDLGIHPDVISHICTIFSSFNQIDEAIIYGSRAKGNYKPGSDIDITLKGCGLDLHYVNQIRNKLDMLDLPQHFDVTVYSQINNPDLLAHIDRVGKLIYFKPSSRP
jgi:uncharacterized protein